MGLTVLIGLAAAGLTASSYIPQIIKMWKTKSVDDVSTAMFAIIFTGYILWLTYGFMANSLPVIVANIFCVTFTLIIIVFKIRFGRTN